MKKIEQTILGIKEDLDQYKETTEFVALTSQLNRDLTKKDKELKERKSKKYTQMISEMIRHLSDKARLDELN